MATSLSKTSDSLASTALLSPSSPSCSVEEAEDDRSTTTASSAIDQLPVLPPDLRQFAGMWAGQGANLGDFYTIEDAPRSTWRCRRSGLRGPKTLKLCWDPMSNCIVLGGRYALDAERFLLNSQCLTWNRVPHHGEGPKQVVWNRRQPREAIPKKAETELVTTKLAVETPELLMQNTRACFEEQTYSRSIMLLVLERSAKKKENDGQTGSTVGIFTESLAKVQFRCPSSMQGMRHTSCTEGKQGAEKKIRQAVRKTKAQRDEDARSNAPGVIDLHVKQQEQEEESEEDAFANRSDGQHSEPTSTQQETCLDWDPCGICAPSASQTPETVEMLARLLFRSQAPQEDASSLRVSAPEFVPSTVVAKQLRSAAAEFLPSAAFEHSYELDEAVALAFEAVGRKPQTL
eukprot:TRINITY_DN102373_c0_g1_i1.p1 TRINITY_DN102373_c0_g1~~TRINITY_DN102373_c0_g1_i1.p1  ORF type:complete len:403 (-),score=76.23 TRINITY_DN102373_c0_g1_i1:496-1704(-)